ncbi:fibronectin type III domain-containing protein [Candidatus Woesearchaeota archaeon]|nr:fibronectin type III domain-containing protein [Candidatus Woesearchaeota archaeon]
MVVNRKFKGLVLVLFLLTLLSAFYVSAATIYGNVTLTVYQDRNGEVNASAKFNFTNQSAGPHGYLSFRNYTSSHAVLTSHFINGINYDRLLPHGFFSDDFQGAEFRSSIVRIPNASYQDSVIPGHGFCGDECSRETTILLGDLVSLVMPGNFSAVLFVKNLTVGTSITFEYKYNNQANNETFERPFSGCPENITIDSCFMNPSFECYWQNGMCLQDTHPDEFDFLSCDMLPRSACQGFNSSFCHWSNTTNVCENGALFHGDYGYNCTAIINSSVCDNSTFTQNTGLCTFANGVCSLNRSKTADNVPDPPAWFCEAPGYINNQSGCGDLQNLYFLPCNWNNQTNNCHFAFFNFNKFDDFDDINSEGSCQSTGGTWKSETTYDPIKKLTTSENWCEMGIAIKKFSEVGAGGQDFWGNTGQLQSCSSECFACEFQTNGSRWPTSANASAVCANSAAGCTFRENGNAFNGFGWCTSAFEDGDLDCDDQCGNCNLLPIQTKQSACQNSSAECKFDNMTQSCIPEGRQSCGQDCFACPDQTGCQGSPAMGGCQWDTTISFCKPRGGQYEICFDGTDNDNNGQTDCDDFKCSFDPFCGGNSVDPNGCFQFERGKYSSPDFSDVAARGNCTAKGGCVWLNDTYGFSSCKPISAQCWENISMEHNQTACEAYQGDTGVTVCSFVVEGECSINSTLETTCFRQTAGTCNAVGGCQWSTPRSICEVAAIGRCSDNMSIQSSQTLCESQNCYWRGNEFQGGSFEGFRGSSNCVEPCQNPGILDAANCAANGSVISAGTCIWSTGFCQAKDSISVCFDYDGDITACKANTNCVWIPLPGDLKNPNALQNGTIRSFQSWMAIGLQRPRNSDTSQNESAYGLNGTDGGYVRIEMAANLSSPDASVSVNISQIICGSQDTRTIFVQYNYSNSTCQSGTCNAFDRYTCNGSTVNYFFNSTMETIEVLWERDVGLLYLDTLSNNSNVTDTANFSTVVVDGFLTNHVPESSSANDSITNATRVRTQTGMCNPIFENKMFQGMDQEPPKIIASDPSGDVASGFIDIVGLGVKKTEEAYAYGIPVRNMSDSAVCNGIKVGTTGSVIGNGTNTSKYYLYLDTNGVSTGGCSASDGFGYTGFEHLFKYVVELQRGVVSEVLTAQICSSGSWVSSNVPVKSNKQHGCGFVGGPILAIDKGTLHTKSNVNTSAKWRAYATATGLGGNSTNVTDGTVPGTADFDGINMKIFDCSSTAQKDNSKCSKFKQFGCFPGEFGPACKDNMDNDGDDETDCNDLDCAYDPFFCGGSFTARADDDDVPTVVWNKINEKVPTQLAFTFGTDEPSNGTVKYYYNDTTCATLNATINDTALSDGDTHTNFRPHHVAKVTGLNANSTYFYKYNVCDPSGNCAMSECSNATTSAKPVNVTFKLDLPDNWTVDIPSLNLTNFTPTYAIKASSDRLTGINITVNDTTSGRSIKFVDVDIFEKQTLNISSFSTGSDFLGIDANQYQAFKQKTGLDKTIVTIPTSDAVVDTILQHCEDDGTDCQDVTGEVTCTFSATDTECEVPDAVGLGFSSYKTTTATTTSSSTTSSSSGGGGGGGGSLPNTAVAPQPAQQPPSTGGTGGQAAAQQQEAQQQAPVAAGGAEAAAQQPAGRAGPSALAGLAMSVGKAVGKVGWVIVLFAAVVVITIAALTWFKKRQE